MLAAPMINTMKQVRRPQGPFAQAYPSIARWVRGYGWIEMGEDLPGHAFIQALDEGGYIWQGEATYPSVDDGLRALDAALAKWMREELCR